MCAACNEGIAEAAKKRLGREIFNCSFCDKEVHPKDMDEAPNGEIFCPATYSMTIKRSVPSNCRVSFEARMVRYGEAGGGL